MRFFICAPGSGAPGNVCWGRASILGYMQCFRLLRAEIAIKILLEIFSDKTLIPVLFYGRDIDRLPSVCAQDCRRDIFLFARNSIFFMGEPNCRRKNGSRTFGCRIGSDIVGYSCRAVLHNAVFRILCVEIRKPKNNQDGGCSLSAGFGLFFIRWLCF